MTIKRAGMTINEQGDQGTFPPWEYENASASSWIGRLGQHRSAVIAIAQKRHEQNEAVKLAKITNKIPVIPEPHVRQKLARTEQRQLVDVHYKVQAIADEVAKKRSSLAPYDYGPGIVPAMQRQELRAALRGMQEKDRMTAMRDQRFRAAALEQPAELSAVPQSLLDRLFDEELRAKFPQDLADLDDAQQAVEFMRETLRTATSAVNAELIQSGTTVAEPDPAAASASWA